MNSIIRWKKKSILYQCLNGSHFACHPAVTVSTEWLAGWQVPVVWRMRTVPIMPISFRILDLFFMPGTSDVIPVAPCHASFFLPFSAVCLTVFLFEFWPRTFTCTIQLNEKGLPDQRLWFWSAVSLSLLNTFRCVHTHALASPLLCNTHSDPLKTAPSEPRSQSLPVPVHVVGVSATYSRRTRNFAKKSRMKNKCLTIRKRIWNRMNKKIKVWSVHFINIGVSSKKKTKVEEV